MAVSFTTSGTPEMYSPVYNPLTYTVSSTNTAQDNFQYLFDLYITGQAGYVRRKVPADPNASGRCYYDPSTILRDYLTKNIDKNDTQIKQNTTSYVAYTVKVGEEYGASSGVTQYADLLTDATRYAWNGAMNSRDFREYTQDDYVASVVYRGKFLTTAPDNLRLYTGTNAWVYMITSGTNVINTVEINTYNSAGTLQQTVEIDNPYKTVSSGDDMFLRMPIGQNLNTILGSQVVVGAQPIITNAVAYFTVRPLNAVGTPTIDQRTYYINTDCTTHETFTFHFLNDLGGYDSFTTIRRSDHDTKAERKSFKRIKGGITSTSAWDYLNSDRGKINYSTKITDTITVNSDWVTEDEAEWLEQLIYSPDVLLDDPTHNFIAVNIIKDSYRWEKQINSDLIQVSFQFEYADMRYRQTSL